MGWFTEDDVKRLLALAVVDCLEFTVEFALAQPEPCSRVVRKASFLD
jgi:hypothetical protein